MEQGHLHRGREERFAETSWWTYLFGKGCDAPWTEDATMEAVGYLQLGHGGQRSRLQCGMGRFGTHRLGHGLEPARKEYTHGGPGVH